MYFKWTFGYCTVLPIVICESRAKAVKTALAASKIAAGICRAYSAARDELFSHSESLVHRDEVSKREGHDKNNQMANRKENLRTIRQQPSLYLLRIVRYSKHSQEPNSEVDGTSY